MVKPAQKRRAVRMRAAFTPPASITAAQLGKGRGGVRMLTHDVKGEGQRTRSEKACTPAGQLCWTRRSGA